MSSLHILVTSSLLLLTPDAGLAAVEMIVSRLDVLQAAGKFLDVLTLSADERFLLGQL